MCLCDKCLKLLNHPLDAKIHDLMHKLVELLMLVDKLDVQDRCGKVLSRNEEDFILELKKELKKQGLGCDYWKD